MVWEPLGGRGGIPSDMVTCSIEGQRRIKVSSEDVFASAVENGAGYAGTIHVEVQADQEVSIKTIHNANTAIRLVEAQDLSISYVAGNESGDLIQMGSGRPLNALTDDLYQYSIEVYAGSPTGERLISRDNELAMPYFINSAAIVGLKNSGLTSTFAVSFAFEAIGDPASPFMLYDGLELDAAAEVSNYNGAN